MYHDYKFVITSENTIVPGYVTEKVPSTLSFPCSTTTQANLLFVFKS